MDQVGKLIKEAQSLSEKKQYRETILLLTDEVLNTHNNPDLFFWRAHAHYQLEEKELPLQFINKALLVNKNHVNSYNLRGLYWSDMGEPDKAILDFNKAIELDPNNEVLYYNRARSWDEKGEYNKAFKDYASAIKIDNKYVTAFNGRGVAWYNKGDYTKAIADFTKAIELDKNLAIAYRNRGISYRLIEEYEKALSDLQTFSTLSPNDAKIHIQLGVVYEKLDKNKEALDEYNEAIRILPSAGNVTYRDALLAKMGVPLKFDTAKADDTLYQIVNAVDEIEDEARKLEIIKHYRLEIEPLINEIREHSSKINDRFWIDGTGNPQPKLVAHYSNLKVLDLLVMNENTHLRYSNAVFMNDPEEGKTLIDYLDFLEEQGKEVPEIKEAFYNIEQKEKTNFYLGSFLPVKDFHEDELLMWRTYGKDENSNEAAGCCMIIDVDFFDTKDLKFIAVGKQLDKELSDKAHPLYKVIYCNKRKGRIEGEESTLIDGKLHKLKGALKKLLGQKVPGDIKLNKAIDRVLYHSLSELRFFFKSADYSYENELRVIQFATHDGIVNIDTTTGQVPRKMYIESTKEIKPHLKKVILGPKVLHPERWMYIEEWMKRKGYKIEMAYSICHFQ
jgi:tetratricopeptide (TPR) repeat protein